MQSSLAYHCKLCGKPGEAKYEPDMVHILDRWVSLLHCNRCSDYLVKLRRLRENCKRLAIIRWRLKSNSKLTADRQDTISSEITNLTRAIAKLVCAHWRVDTVWQPDFVEQLIDFPDKAEFIVNQYASIVQDNSKQTLKLKVTGGVS